MFEYDKVVLDGSTIGWTDSVNIVNNNLSDVDDCKLKRQICIGSVNKFFGNYGRLQHNILSKPFNTYCCFFYVSPLWNLQSDRFKAMEQINTQVVMYSISVSCVAALSSQGPTAS